MKKERIEHDRLQTQKPAAASAADRVTIVCGKEEDAGLKAAIGMLGPFVPNAIAASVFTRGSLGELVLDKIVTAMMQSATRIKEGDLKEVEAILMSQATVLNAMFADLVNRSATNRKEGYYEAAERYLKMAFKAQNQCRMTLESLSTVKNPPVVYARQANIAHGPQQVNNGTAAPTRTKETENRPNELLEAGNEERLDNGAPTTASGANKTSETLGAVHRPSKHAG